MRFWGEVERRFGSPDADFWVCGGVFSERRVGVGEVGEMEKDLALILFAGSGLGIEGGDFVADATDLGFDFGGIFTARFLSADFFADPLAIGLEMLESGFDCSAFGIDGEDGVNFQVGIAAARGEACADEVWLIANEADIEHGSGG